MKPLLVLFAVLFSVESGLKRADTIAFLLVTPDPHERANDELFKLGVSLLLNNFAGKTAVVSPLSAHHALTSVFWQDLHKCEYLAKFYNQTLSEMDDIGYFELVKKAFCAQPSDNCPIDLPYPFDFGALEWISAEKKQMSADAEGQINVISAFKQVIEFQDNGIDSTLRKKDDTFYGVDGPRNETTMTTQVPGWWTENDDRDLFQFATIHLRRPDHGKFPRYRFVIILPQENVTLAEVLHSMLNGSASLPAYRYRKPHHNVRVRMPELSITSRFVLPPDAASSLLPESSAVGEKYRNAAISLAPIVQQSVFEFKEGPQGQSSGMIRWFPAHEGQIGTMDVRASRPFLFGIFQQRTPLLLGQYY